MRKPALLAACAALAASPADAHLMNTGFGPFYDGLAHPLLTIEDLLPLIAVALLAGLGGALYASQVQSIQINSFNFIVGLPVLLTAVVGGMAYAGSGMSSIIRPAMTPIRMRMTEKIRMEMRAQFFRQNNPMLVNREPGDEDGQVKVDPCEAG